MDFSPFILTLLGNTIIAIGIILTILVVKIIKNKLNNYLEYIIATTVGLLLGIIFLGFLPELIEGFHGNGVMLGVYILIGLGLFYLFELFLHWHHCKDLAHETKCGHSHNHEHKNGLLMFGGTILHNSFHGVILFAAFSVDLHFGIATTLAILLHSIPQNIVNYIMNHNNIKYAYFAAFGGILGAVITYPFAGFLIENKDSILAIITGGLLYTALTDIFPEFKGKGTTGKKLVYLLFITLGISMFLGFNSLSGHDHSHEKEHDHESHGINLNEECNYHNGTWINGINECEGIDEHTCEELSGTFNGCESACRNNPEASVCTMQCVRVCKFGNK